MSSQPPTACRSAADRSEPPTSRPPGRGERPLGPSPFRADAGGLHPCASSNGSGANATRRPGPMRAAYALFGAGGKQFRGGRAGRVRDAFAGEHAGDFLDAAVVVEPVDVDPRAAG